LPAQLLYVGELLLPLLYNCLSGAALCLLLLLKHLLRLVSLRFVLLCLSYVYLFFIAATVLAALAYLLYLLILFCAICSSAHVALLLSFFTHYLLCLSPV
jgi:hypothetical protein